MGIRIENLSKSFGEKVIFKEFSYQFPDRGIVKITGASGQGKTTLMRMISGLDKDYSGTINGVGTVSYLFQEHRLFPWLSALDNVLIASFPHPDNASRDIAVELLGTLGLSGEDIMLKPSKLSGGMKQRVSIARALLAEADVLILDEPTKELDGELVRVVATLIEEAARSRLVLVSSHDNALDSLENVGEIKVQTS